RLFALWWSQGRSWRRGLMAWRDVVVVEVVAAPSPRPAGGLGARARHRAAVEGPRSSIHRRDGMDRRYHPKTLASARRLAGIGDHAAAADAGEQYATHPSRRR